LAASLVAACTDRTLTGSPLPTGGIGSISFPAQEEADPPVSGPEAESPSAGPAFKSKVVPTKALESAKQAGTKYCPFIQFEVKGAAYSPRWPGATVAYFPGKNPLPKVQRDLLRDAAVRLNQAAGTQIFTMLPDGAATADLPITDSTEFPKLSILGETEAKIYSRYGAASISIEVVEVMKLRPQLPNGLFFRVALHEFGHAAGLEHNPAANSLMNQGTSTRTPDQFSDSERASLRLLYGLPDVPLLDARRETQSLGIAPPIAFTID
jgi:hypothetical protein